MQEENLNDSPCGLLWQSGLLQVGCKETLMKSELLRDNLEMPVTAGSNPAKRPKGFGFTTKGY